MNDEERRIAKKSETLPGVEKWIIKILESGIKQGSTHKFDFLLENIRGKVPEKIEVESPDGSMTPKANIYIPDNKRGKE